MYVHSEFLSRYPCGYDDFGWTDIVQFPGPDLDELEKLFPELS